MAYLHRQRHPQFWQPGIVPSGPFQIDWSHPLASGLCALYIPGSFAGLADLTGIGPTLTAYPASYIGASYGGAGLHAKTNNSGADGAMTPALKTALAGSALSLYWRGAIGPISGSDPFIWGIQPNNNNTGPYFYFGVLGDGGTYLAEVASFQAIRGPSLPSVLTPATMAVSVGGSPSYSLFINGNSYASASGTAPGASNYGTTPMIQMGCFTSDTNRNSNSITEMGAFYSRALTASEVAWLDRDPYAMLIPRRNRLRSAAILSNSRPFIRIMA